jgi:ABC-type multidrug transport system fused ATPase/permease subunit
VALVGDVGAGKSQLLLSLLGETPASCSRFCFLGRNIETEEDRRWLLSQVSYVGQDGFVLSGSIRENLSLRYDDGREEDDFKAQALRRSQFELVSEGMSSGLETMIGERGVNLSGGQRQRVGLARADVFDRPVVFLDDALSAVDIKTENRLVQELFDGAWRHKTRLLVTHRMSVLAKVDRIIFLRHGKIAATGPLAELQKRRDFQEFMEVEGQQVRAQ